MGRSGLCLLGTLAFCGGIGGCGDSGSSSPLPEVRGFGGPHMAHPQLVPIFFGDDTDVATLTSFSRWIVGSSWLKAVGADYGVGTGSVLGVVNRTDAASVMIDDTAIIDLLYAGLADGTLPRPAGGLASVLYMVQFPAQTMVTSGGAQSCVDFGGYHNSARRNGVELSYAVVATCSGYPGTMSDVEGRELVSSHELIEAATDPVPGNHPGFELTDPISPWVAIGGGEVGDLCVSFDASDLWREAGFVAQRSWSNTAAGASHDPCVPGSATAPYFSVVPMVESLPRIPPGGHQTIEVRGFATNLPPGTSWQLATLARPNGPQVTPGAPVMKDGETTALDITVPAAAPPGVELSFFVLSRTAADPNTNHVLPMRVAVGDPCVSFTGCESCTAQDGCGFCATTGKCEALGASGSSESGCPASSFATFPGSCNGFCASHGASCTDCASQDGCGRCASGATHCLAIDRDTALPAKTSCPYADWNLTPDYCSP